MGEAMNLEGQGLYSYSVLSAQYFWEPKTTIKIVIKKRLVGWRPWGRRKIDRVGILEGEGED